MPCHKAMRVGSYYPWTYRDKKIGEKHRKQNTYYTDRGELPWPSILPQFGERQSTEGIKCNDKGDVNYELRVRIYSEPMGKHILGG